MRLQEINPEIHRGLSVFVPNLFDMRQRLKKVDHEIKRGLISQIPSSISGTINKKKTQGDRPQNP